MKRDLVACGLVVLVVVLARLEWWSRRADRMAWPKAPRAPFPVHYPPRAPPESGDKGVDAVRAFA